MTTQNNTQSDIDTVGAQALEVVALVDKVIIKNDEDRAKATELLSILSMNAKSIEEQRTDLVKPLNDTVKKINANAKKYSQPIDDAITKIKRGIANYMLEQERKAREKEEKELAKRAEKNAKREAEGKAPVLTTLQSVARPEATMRTEAGRTTTRKVWKFELVDDAKVPAEYRSADIAKIKVAVSNGVREIDGVRIYEDVVVSTTATM
jgi:hypothetical protein